MIKRLREVLGIMCGVFIVIVFIAFITLIISSSTFAVSNTRTATVIVPDSCTLGSTNNIHTETLENGTYDNNIGGTSQSPNPTTFTVHCNDLGGYVVYAIGASNGVNGNTNLIGDNNLNIATGTATSGNTSNWAFKMAALDNSLTLNSSYSSNFASIPSSWAWVAKKASGVVGSSGSSFTATYAAYISSTQGAGTYTGQVKYALFHPSTSSEPTNIEDAFSNNNKTKVSVLDPNTGITSTYYKMQDMNTTICSDVNIFGNESEARLVDTRDNKLYYVAKLEDGKCWMTENLRFSLTQNTPYITSENTDLNLYGSMGYDSSNGYTCAGGSGTNCSGGVISWAPESSTTSGSMEMDPNNPYSYSGRMWDEPDGKKDGHGYAGIYYNWPSAIASNNASSYTTGDAANSICPAGWKLPSSNNYDFSRMLYAYGITTDATNTPGYADSTGYTKMNTTPLYFVQSGMNMGGGITASGELAFYHSSSAKGSTTAKGLGFYSESVNPADSGGGFRGIGISVRCMVRE